MPPPSRLWRRSLCLRLLLHLFTANRYGIFRDELYYYACSQHMAWGYVDMPPFIPAVTWLFTEVLGSSLIRAAPDSRTRGKRNRGSDRISCASVGRKTLRE